MPNPWKGGVFFGKLPCDCGKNPPKSLRTRASSQSPSPLSKMSSASIQIIHKERLPATGCLVIPGRLDFEFIPHFEKLFAGRKITWLIEETRRPTIRRSAAYLEKSGSGAMFAADDAAPAAAGSQLKPYLADGGVLIFVPGRATVRHGTACHIPSAHLKTLCAFELPILPIAADCPRESCLSIERQSSLPSAVISIGKPIPRGDVERRHLPAVPARSQRGGLQHRARFSTDRSPWPCSKDSRNTAPKTGSSTARTTPSSASTRSSPPRSSYQSSSRRKPTSHASPSSCLPARPDSSPTSPCSSPEKSR